MYWLCLVLIALLYAIANHFSSKPAGVSEVVLVFLCIPRLHDIGKSGWYVLIGIAIELTGIATGFTFFDMPHALMVSGISVLIIAGLLIWLGLIRGENITNHWGDPPPPGLSFKWTARNSEAK